MFSNKKYFRQKNKTNCIENIIFEIENFLSNWSTIEIQNFVLNYWKTIFEQCETNLKIIIIYHLFANNQTKQFNQTIKTIFKCLLIEKYKKN